MAQGVPPAHWACLGANPGFAEGFPAASRLCSPLTYRPTARRACQRGSRTKQRGLIFEFSLCEVPNQASVVSAESPLCPIRNVEFPTNAIDWPVRVAMLLSPTFARQLQGFMIEEFLWMKTLPVAQEVYDIHSWPLLTCSLGCCFLSSTASVSYSELLPTSICSRYTQPSN